MIYRAIIEQVIDKYTAKIRIPVIHRSTMSAQHSKLESLPIAKICTLSNSHPNIKTGDIVAVAFENGDSTKPIIIGYLYLEENLKSNGISTTMSSLQVTEEAKLSEETSIGSVSSENIKQLKGATKNIQQQLNEIITRLDDLESKNFDSTTLSPMSQSTILDIIV